MCGVYVSIVALYLCTGRGRGIKEEARRRCGISRLQERQARSSNGAERKKASRASRRFPGEVVLLYLSRKFQREGEGRGTRISPYCLSD